MLLTFEKNFEKARYYAKLSNFLVKNTQGFKLSSSDKEYNYLIDMIEKAENSGRLFGYVKKQLVLDKTDIVIDGLFL